MNPGRELDALIAEKVMGWKLWSYDEDRYASSDADYLNAATNDGWTWEGSDSEAWEWRPSTDIDAAWEVVTKMRERDIAMALGSVKHMTAVPTWGWVAKFEWTDKRLGYQFEFSMQESAPHAICEAALKVIGYEQG